MSALKRSTACFTVVIWGVGLLGAATASAQSAGQEVVGTWTLVSATVKKDGKRRDIFGHSPQGQVVFDGHGNYSLVMMRADIPKFVNNSRTKGSAAENAAVVRGSIAHFGVYSYNDKDKTYTLHIKSCTYPNWNNTSQTRRLIVSGDELHWFNAAGSTGAGSLEITLRRLK